VRVFAIAAVALCLCLTTKAANAEPTTIEKIDEWCNVAELRPADTDFDKGLTLATLADARLGAINTELSPLMTAIRSLYSEKESLEKAVGALREERAVRANRENDSTRDVDARLARALARIDAIGKQLPMFETRSSTLSAEARKLFDDALRLGRDANDVASGDSVSATKKKKATLIADKTRQMLRWHFAIVKTLSGQ